MVRTRKRKAPRMRQRITGREKIPGSELGVGRVPKVNKAKRILGWAWVQRNSLMSASLESLDVKPQLLT